MTIIVVSSSSVSMNSARPWVQDSSVVCGVRGMSVCDVGGMSVIRAKGKCKGCVCGGGGR